ncbi:MAG: AbrB/MazE/SpoVT family DNA-binding domain-containing protein [Clostridia bacterium]|nr:AbrB/MazE/SpoVT family DNA-binding domain-containing protein [Clostridia bacterium]
MIGIVKEIDNLGRIVIPKEIRDAFKLTKEVEIILTEDGILIRNPQYVIIKKCSDTH